MWTCVILSVPFIGLLPQGAICPDHHHHLPHARHGAWQCLGTPTSVPLSLLLGHIPCTACLLLTPKTSWVTPGATASADEETTFVLSSTLMAFLSQMLLSSIPVLFLHRLCSHRAVLAFSVDVAVAAGVVNVSSQGFWAWNNYNKMNGTFEIGPLKIRCLLRYTKCLLIQVNLICKQIDPPDFARKKQKSAARSLQRIFELDDASASNKLCRAVPLEVQFTVRMWWCSSAMVSLGVKHRMAFSELSWVVRCILACMESTLSVFWEFISCWWWWDQLCYLHALWLDCRTARGVGRKLGWVNSCKKLVSLFQWKMASVLLRSLLFPLDKPEKFCTGDDNGWMKLPAQVGSGLQGSPTVWALGFWTAGLDHAVLHSHVMLSSQGTAWCPPVLFGWSVGHWLKQREQWVCRFNEGSFLQWAQSSSTMLAAPQCLQTHSCCAQRCLLSQFKYI